MRNSLNQRPRAHPRDSAEVLGVWARALRHTYCIQIKILLLIFLSIMGEISG